MEKVTEIYFEKDRSKLGPYETGIILFLEGGERLYQYSTDPIQTYADRKESSDHTS